MLKKQQYAPSLREKHYIENLTSSHRTTFFKLPKGLPIVTPIMGNEKTKPKENQIIFYEKKENKSKSWHYKLHDPNQKHPKGIKIQRSSLIKTLNKQKQNHEIFFDPLRYMGTKKQSLFLQAVEKEMGDVSLTLKNTYISCQTTFSIGGENSQAGNNHIVFLRKNQSWHYRYKDQAGHDNEARVENRNVMNTLNIRERHSDQVKALKAKSLKYYNQADILAIFKDIDPLGEQHLKLEQAFKEKSSNQGPLSTAERYKIVEKFHHENDTLLEKVYGEIKEEQNPDIPLTPLQQKFLVNYENYRTSLNDLYATHQYPITNIQSNERRLFETFLQEKEEKGLLPNQRQLFIQTGEKVGAGTFGQVTLWKNSHGEDYVVKKISMGSQSLYDTQNEIDIAREKGLVTDNSSLVDDPSGDQPSHKSIWIVSPYKGEELESFIEKNTVDTDENTVSIDLPWLKLTVMQVMTQVEMLHKKNILHRDLRPNNMVVNNQGKLTIIDYGTAIKCSPGNLTYQSSLLEGTDDYLAPELTHSQLKTYSEKSEVYAIGETVKGIITSTTQGMIFWKTNQTLRNIINSMTNDDPNQRPTIEDAQKRLREEFDYPNQPIASAKLLFLTKYDPTHPTILKKDIEKLFNKEDTNAVMSLGTINPQFITKENLNRYKENPELAFAQILFLEEYDPTHSTILKEKIGGLLRGNNKKVVETIMLLGKMNPKFITKKNLNLCKENPVLAFAQILFLEEYDPNNPTILKEKIGGMLRVNNKNAVEAIMFLGKMNPKFITKENLNLYAKHKKLLTSEKFLQKSKVFLENFPRANNFSFMLKVFLNKETDDILNLSITLLNRGKDYLQKTTTETYKIGNPKIDHYIKQAQEINHPDHKNFIKETEKFEKNVLSAIDRQANKKDLNKVKTDYVTTMHDLALKNEKMKTMQEKIIGYRDNNDSFLFAVYQKIYQFKYKSSWKEDYSKEHACGNTTEKLIRQDNLSSGKQKDSNPVSTGSRPIKKTLENRLPPSKPAPRAPKQKAPENLQPEESHSTTFSNR